MPNQPDPDDPSRYERDHEREPGPFAPRTAGPLTERGTLRTLVERGADPQPAFREHIRTTEPVTQSDRLRLSLLANVLTGGES